MNRLSFRVSREDGFLIGLIVDRAMRICKKHNVDYDREVCEMDLTACHASGCRLKLQKLLEADDFNFCHDVFGIRRHLNRKTGQLEDCFLPRFYKGD